MDSKSDNTKPDKAEQAANPDTSGNGTNDSLATVRDTVTSVGSGGLGGSPSGDNALRNVIVNFIPPEWTETELQKHFDSYGSVDQVKLVREKGNQNSKCFGFVIFKTPEAAQAGIAGSNGFEVNGKKLKVALANPPDGYKNVNVYIAGLKKEATEADLRTLFGPFGTIQSVNVLATSRRGEAFIRYSSDDDAEKAVQSMNGVPLVRASDNVVLCDQATVKFANKSKPRNSKTSHPASAAAQAAQVQAVAAAQAAAMSPSQMANLYMNPYAAMGAMYPGYAPPSPDQYPAAPTPTSVFVYNLPSNVEEQMLYMMFAMYGTVQSMNVIKNPDGTCKGYGFVNYWSPYEAAVAIQCLNGFHLGDKVLQVRFKDAPANKTRQQKSNTGKGHSNQRGPRTGSTPQQSPQDAAQAPPKTQAAATQS